MPRTIAIAKETEGGGVREVSRHSRVAGEPGDTHAGAADRLATNNFDLLRLLFASMVVVYHTGILSQSPALAWMQTWMSGDLGVQGFYVVSGFLVTMSFERCSSLWSFAEKRFRRIAPAYVIVVVGAAVLLVLISRLSWVEYFSSRDWFSYVGWNLLLSNFVFPNLPGVFEGNYKQAVNGSLWTIKIEVAFYCMVPVIAWLGHRVGEWRTWAALLVASLVWRMGFDLFAVWSGNAIWAKLAIQAPGQLSFFLVGAMAYKRTRLGLPSPPLWLAIIGCVIYATTDGLAHEFAAPFAVGTIVYWAAISCSRRVDIGRYGDFSYGIYLYHWPILQTFIALGWFATSPGLAAFGAFVTVAMVSIGSWYLVERRYLSHRRTAAA